MTEIIMAVIPVVIIGIICAAVLVVASKLMAVEENEKFPIICRVSAIPDIKKDISYLGKFEKTLIASPPGDDTS